MDFGKEGLTCEQARNYDIVQYLSSLGIEPAKIKGTDFWYYSPFRGENTPSFKVNQRINRWFDFGEGAGGNLIDLAIRLSDCTVGEFLQALSISPVSFHQRIYHKQTSVPDLPRITILQERTLTASALLNYLQKRRIPLSIADQFCREVHCQVGDKKYFAIGFKNDSGGYELRNPYFKGCSSPKDITTIRNIASRVSVFEGFFDFFSYLVLMPVSEVPPTDYLVLNSLSFFEKARMIMECYSSIHLYLDNNKAGQNCKIYAASLSNKYVDESTLYKNYEDLNDFLCLGKGIP